MNGKLKIAIIAIIVVMLAGVGYIAFKKTQKNATEKEAIKKVTNPVTGEVVGDKLPKTNPFDTTVNPFDSYKNPFGN